MHTRQTSALNLAAQANERPQHFSLKENRNRRRAKRD